MNIPIDPQDLLYTNQFINSNLITNQERKKNIKNFGDLQRKLEKTKNQEYNYLEDSTKNINKVSQNEWPSKNKNRYPLFSESINDIVENKYKKVYKTNLYINSKDRNKTLYLFPNNYQIEIPSVFNNIQKIVLKDVYIPNYLTPINETNNILCWQYLNLEVINLLKINYNIIPCIKSESFIGIPYTNLKDSYTKLSLQELTNKCYFKYSNPSIEEFNEYINKEIQTKHIINEEIPYKNELIPTMNNNGLMKTLFYIDIDSNSGKVNIINRLEELSILGIQTFGKLTLSEINNYDIYHSYIKTKISTSNLNPNSVYFLIEYNGNYINYIQQTPGYPLIITDCPSIEGFNKYILNLTELYSANMYYDYMSVSEADKTLETVSNYKFFDIIEIGKTKLLRIEVNFSSGNINSNFYIETGNPIISINPQTIILNNSLKNYFYNGEINTNFRLINDIKSPKIGRAICFRLVNDTNIINNDITNFTLTELLSDKLFSCNKELKKSFLIDLFKWEITDITFNINSFEFNNNTKLFRFIHCNYNNVEYRLNDIINNLFDSSEYTLKQLYNYYNNKIIQLQKFLEIEKFENKHYFRVMPFIYIRITFNKKENNNTSSQHLRCVDSKNLQYNNSYVPYLETLIDNKKYIKKDSNSITAKINLSNIYGQPNDLFYTINEEIRFYEQLYNKLENINIEFLNYDGKLISNIFENSLTLEIYEEKEVLKETLINSKTGIINSNGKI